MTKLYAYVDEGEVKRLVRKNIPKDLTDTELREQYKLFPVDDKKPSLQPWERLGPRSEEILATKVNFTYDVKTTPLDAYKRQKRQQLIKNAKNALEARLDPIEQMPSVYKVLPQARRDAMDADAQAVVTEVGQKRTAINQATTHQEVDKVYIGIVAFFDGELDENGVPIVEEVI